jgi:hypothetical protein
VLATFVAADGEEECILAPEGSKPTWTVVEKEHPEDESLNKGEKFNRFRQFKAYLEVQWEQASFCPVRSLLLAILFPVSFFRLFMMCFVPTLKRRLQKAVNDKVAPMPRTEFAIPFTDKEAAERLAATLRNIGAVQEGRLAPIVIILGHGSRTVNNPFDAAHNCGACGGREGGVNARLMAKCANKKEIRAILKKDFNVTISDDTWFLGGYHDTSSELIDLFDTELIPLALQAAFKKAAGILEKGRGVAALERCSKFMHAIQNGVTTPEQAVEHVWTRSTDLGQARPELGHATNGSVIIGRRSLTKGLFLARRSFLPSYDPMNDDENGTYLEGVITPALIVCSGISLEYLFSTVEGGAGTKVACNIVGNFGVMQGASGDLLVGLPTQMTEMHPPVRSMFLVEAPVARVQAVLKRKEVLRQIVENDWVRLFVRDPYTNKLYRQSKGQYTPVDMNYLLCESNSDYTSLYEPKGHKKKKSAQTKCHDETNSKFIPYTPHLKYALTRTHYEMFMAVVIALGMVLSCGLSIHFFNCFSSSSISTSSISFSTSLDINGKLRGGIIAIGGTVLALCNVGFSRRYLHGEFMYDRFLLLAFVMLTGFNLIAASAPSDSTETHDLKFAAMGWSLLSFSSVFLISAWNHRKPPKP